MNYNYETLDRMIATYGVYDKRVVDYARKLEKRSCGSIWFDMDGTVADLYGQENWLERLRSFDSGVYSDCEPKVNMEKLEVVCRALQAKGWKVGVISWASKENTDEFFAATVKAKTEWLNKYMPYVDEVYIQEYGVAKAKAPKKKNRTMILVDDNEEVRKEWNTPKQRSSIDAKNLDIIRELMKLL